VDEVADRGAVQSQPPGELVLSHVEPLEILLEALRFFDWVQVSALNVFDQSRLEHLPVVEVDDVYWHLGDAGGLSCAKATFTGDQLKLAAHSPNHERLENAVGADAFAQRGQLFVIKGLAGLVGVLLNLIESHAGERPVAESDIRLVSAQESIQAAA